MASTAATLITETLDNTGRASTGTTRSGATLENKGIEWLNKILVRLSRKHDFREMKKKFTNTTAADTKNYAFPTNYKVIRDITLIDGSSSVKLTLVRPEVFDRMIPYPENNTTGRPRIYVPYGKSYDLDRIPDAAYTVYCRAILWPTIITVTTATIDYDTDKDDVIVAGMTALGFKYMQMYEDAAVWEQDYIRLRNEAIDIDTNMPDYEPVGHGFDSVLNYRGKTFIGDYWNAPFIMES